MSLGLGFSLLRSALPAGAALLWTALAATGAEDAPANIRLAAGGRALHPVVVGEKATERTRAAAGELAAYLERISGAQFPVTVGDGATAIAVGVPADFPALPFNPGFRGGPFGREEYVLRTHARGVWLVGSTEVAVEDAVWDLLHRLGCRQFFPTGTWEVVPRLETLQVSLDVREIPDFITRLAPRLAARTGARELWEKWQRRNRITSAFTLSTGHSYGAIVSANKAAFEANPGYFALVDGARVPGGGNAKFCTANPGLRRLVVAHAVRFFRENPDADSISLDPSDGGGWCECDACAKLGSVTDRALTLANEVAEAINGLGLGDKHVGIYAYSQHSPPPTLRVHPKVIVSVATSFIRGGYTLEQLIEGWRARGATLGIREYHDVYTWSRDMPGKARGGDIAYLKQTIPYFLARGARFMNSESSDSWGANGLGYYLSARFLWDVDEVNRADALIEDFLAKAFGPAKEPMRRFYALLNLDKSLRSNEDLVARMYRCLDEARRLAADAGIRARLDDLLLYTRYVELYADYDNARGAERQAAYEALVRHAWRMRETMMVSHQQVFRDLPHRDKSISLSAECAWDVPEGLNPWKSARAFDEAELAAILRDGIARNQVAVLGFEPVAFGEDLVPADVLKLPAVAPGSLGTLFRGNQKLHTWLPRDAGRLEVRLSGGHIYQDRGNVKVRLFAAEEATLEPVARDENVAPDRQEHAVSLKTPYSGLHTLEWSDGTAGTRVIWPEGLPLTLRSSLEDPARLEGRWSLYFYVPRDTRVVGGWSDSIEGAVLDGDGKRVFEFASLGRAGYFRVAVPAGQDGRLWKFEACAGRRMLMTVPPYLARSEKELLLPRAVVERDVGRPAR